MRTTSQILQMLDMTYVEYDAWQWENFLNWCYDRSAKTNIPVKTLIKNDHLLNWYQEQWEFNVESQFIDDNADFIGVSSPTTYFDLITTYPDDILNVYPLPILKTIKKTMKNA